MDNSGKDNKNSFLMTFLGWLVKKGIFRKIKVSFLMAGHTHEDIDQVFSRISVHLRQVNVATLPDLLEAVSSATIPAPQVHNLEGIFDYKQCLASSRGAIEGISGPHQFVIRKEVEKIGIRYKDWPTDSETRSVDITALVPATLAPVGVVYNKKIETELQKLVTDLPKWEQSGLLNRMELEWWNSFISGQDRTKQHPNVPVASVLPTFTYPQPMEIGEDTSHLVCAISSRIDKHKRKSILKAKKQRRFSSDM